MLLISNTFYRHELGLIASAALCALSPTVALVQRCSRYTERALMKHSFRFAVFRALRQTNAHSMLSFVRLAYGEMCGPTRTGQSLLSIQRKDENKAVF